MAKEGHVYFSIFEESTYLFYSHIEEQQFRWLTCHFTMYVKGQARPSNESFLLDAIYSIKKQIQIQTWARTLVMLCPLHQVPLTVFGYSTVSVGIPTAGRQILKPRQFPRLLFLAKSAVLGCVTCISAEKHH